MGYVIIIYIVLLILSNLLLFKIKDKITRFILIPIVSLGILPVIFFIYLFLGTIDCYVRKYEIKPTWSCETKAIGDIIYLDNDSLYSFYYIENSNRLKSSSKTFNINKNNGKVNYELINQYSKKSAQTSFYCIGKEYKHSSFGYEIDERSFVLTSDYKGFTITYNHWYKNVRESNNEYSYLAIYKNDKLIKKIIFPTPYDIVWDYEAVYIVRNNIEKYSYEDVLKTLLSR